MLKPRECAGQKPNYEAAEYAMPSYVWQRGLTNNAAGQNPYVWAMGSCGVAVLRGVVRPWLHNRHGIVAVLRGWFRMGESVLRGMAGA